MQNKYTSYRSTYLDFTMITFFILSLINVYAVVFQEQFLTFNLVVLNLLIVISILTFYLPVTGGIVATILVTFTYSTIVIIVVYLNEFLLGFHVYYWIIAIPTNMICVVSYKYHLDKLYSDNDHLSAKLDSYTTYDEDTSLKNMTAFYNTTNTYIDIVNRNNLELSIIVCELAYHKNIKSMLSDENHTKLLKQLSIALNNNIRTEDEIFILDKNPYRVGLVMITDPNQIELVKRRLKEAVNEENIINITQPAKIKLQLKISAITVDTTEDITPLDLYHRTIKELDYDIAT